MAFVDRDGSNKVVAVFARLQRPGQEELPDTDAAVVAFFNPPPLTADQLEAQGSDRFTSDRALMAAVRVIAKEINALRTQAGLTPFTVNQWLAKFAAAYGGKAIP